MTPARRSVILEDIKTAPSAEYLSGLIGGLRLNGEMADPEVALAVRDKLKAEGWPYQVPEWAERRQT